MDMFEKTKNDGKAQYVVANGRSTQNVGLTDHLPREGSAILSFCINSFSICIDRPSSSRGVGKVAAVNEYYLSLVLIE